LSTLRATMMGCLAGGEFILFSAVSFSAEWTETRQTQAPVLERRESN